MFRSFFFCESYVYVCIVMFIFFVQYKFDRNWLQVGEENEECWKVLILLLDEFVRIVMNDMLNLNGYSIVNGFIIVYQF